MEGFLTQVTSEEGSYGLYWSSVEIEEEIFKQAYLYWSNLAGYNEDTFEEWWNDQNTGIQIERIFLNEIWI